MNCIYCGKPLYQHLSLRLLFKTNYVIHESCENLLWINATDYIPIGQTMMALHPLFDYDKKGNDNVLFFFLGKVLINAYLNHDSDIILFIENSQSNILDSINLYLVSQLAKVSLYIITLYRTRLM